MQKTASKKMKARFAGFLATALFTVASVAGIELSHAAELTAGYAKLNSVGGDVLAARYRSGPVIILPSVSVCRPPYVRQIDEDTFLITNSPCASRRDGLSLLLLRREAGNVLTLSDIIKPDKLGLLNVIPVTGRPATVEFIYVQGKGRNAMLARLSVSISAGRFVFGRQPSPANDILVLPDSIYRDLHRINFSPERIEILGCALFSRQTMDLAAKIPFDVCPLADRYIADIRYLQSSSSDRLDGIATRQVEKLEIGTTFTIVD